MSMTMSESQGEEDEGEHELQHEYERRIRVAPMAANQLAACLCVCEPVLQVIAHDAVLLWPDGPKRASRSTKKHSALAAQRDRMGPKTRAGARKKKIGPCRSARHVHIVLLRVQHLVCGQSPAGTSGEPHS